MCVDYPKTVFLEGQIPLFRRLCRSDQSPTGTCEGGRAGAVKGTCKAALKEIFAGTPGGAVKGTLEGGPFWRKARHPDPSPSTTSASAGLGSCGEGEGQLLVFVQEGIRL